MVVECQATLVRCTRFRSMKFRRYFLPFCFFLLIPPVLSAQDCPDSCAYFIPNTLTPDCDGVGCEILEIVSSCTFSQFDFTLYDKWGNVHFHSTDPKIKFDSGSSAQGTYTWVFIGRYCNGFHFSHQGQLLILR